MLYVTNTHIKDADDHEVSNSLIIDELVKAGLVERYPNIPDTYRVIPSDPDSWEVIENMILAKG